MSGTSSGTPDVSGFASTDAMQAAIAAAITGLQKQHWPDSSL